MVYTPWPTISNNDPWSADTHDQLFKDNFAAMPPPIFTTKGDIAVATGADACDRFPAGTNGQIVEAASGETLKMKNSWGYVPIGGIIMWSGLVGDLPSNWKLCNGANGTPNLQNKFVIGAGSTYSVGNTGGAASRNLQHNHTITSQSQGVSHDHAQDETNAGSAHLHGVSTGAPSAAQALAYDVAGYGVSNDTHVHTFNTANETSHVHNTFDTNTEIAAHTHSIVMDNQLSSSQNMMPTYYALAYIMRIS